jgi:hypothetical protein
MISRFKKERHLRSLSEDDFRDTVIRPLFLRLGYFDGRDTCGPAEAGKDCLFIERDRFGIDNVVAVQTKKGNLNLASNASQNVVVAVTQLTTALSTPVTLLATKQRVIPNQAYLCASGKINDAARNHILDIAKSPNIRFLDAEDLIPKIDEHIPEVWLGIEADVLPYFRGIMSQVEGDDHEPQAVGGVGPESVLRGAASDILFVQLRLYRTILKPRKVMGRIRRDTDIEEFKLTPAISKKSRRILIVGEAGSGKSTALLRLAYEIARDGIQESGEYRVPVLLRALDVWAEKPHSLHDYCVLACRKVAGGSRPCFTMSDLVKGRVLLLLDSLDELPSDEARAYVVGLIDTMLLTYPKVQVIATSRPHAFTGTLRDIHRYTEYRLSPISWHQASKILKAVKRRDRLSEAQSQELLRQLEKLHGVELNPLLVTVFAATTDYSKQDIPANITELFKKFTELMLGRWDESKGLKHQYQAPLKDFVLTKLANRMHASRQTIIDRELAESIVKAELALRGYEADAHELLAEVFDRSGLFRVLEGSIEFRHLLLQEFFAGRGIDSVDQAKSMAADEWWTRALVFYFGENPQRIDILEEMTKQRPVGGAREQMTAATTIALALQACYLSPVTEKLQIWKWAIDTMSAAREGFLADMDPDGRFPHLGFLQYYLTGRDASALSHLLPNIAELRAWCEVPDSLDVDAAEVRLFWLIVGLMESGQLAAAESLVQRFHPKDAHLALGVHLGAFLTEKIRPVSATDRKVAHSICEKLDGSIASLKKELMRELGSTLIEMRDGKPTGIEHEVIADDRESD